jgi:UDPglucose 6-dehydrogenase
MRVAVIGTGHVGLVTAATMASIGHDVVGIDDDRQKVDLLRSGGMPFYERGLEALVHEQVAAGRLRFAHDPAEALPGIEVAFVCVGTPQGPEGEANLAAVEAAARAIGTHATGDMVVVHKSTVPVQTAERVDKVLRRVSGHRFWVVSNPEFLREGTAVEDSLRPDRILVGSDEERAFGVMRELFAPLLGEGPLYFETDLRTAELAKHACNAFLAMKISYVNALARVCEASGADVMAVAAIMGADRRIGGSFLDAGLGWGGYCLPKDVAAFRAQTARVGYEFRLLEEVARINVEAIDAAFEKVSEALWNLEGKRIAMLGLSFKAGTDDVRESPALRLAARLLEAGATVVGTDPQANQVALEELPGLQVASDAYEAATGAHALVIGTEWREFASLDLERLKGIMTHAIIVDGRNLLDPTVVADSGFTYLPVGRPAINL